MRRESGRRCLEFEPVRASEVFVETLLQHHQWVFAIGVQLYLWVKIERVTTGLVREILQGAESNSERFYCLSNVEENPSGLLHSVRTRERVQEGDMGSFCLGRQSSSA